MPDAAQGLGEFDLIARYFAPLSAGAPGAFNLTDDAAEIAISGSMIISCDAIVEGVHFLATDPLTTVAQKALRVNLSDMAAKGAKPTGWLLMLAWPKGRDVAEIADLAAGFADDVALYGVPLLGGDTVSTPGPLMLSVTIFGTPLGARMVRRAGAKVGDLVCVTGTLGDGWLGLQTAQGNGLGLSSMEAAFLTGRYRTPNPRLEAAMTVATNTNASMDVSDGLMADAGHLAKASGVGLVLDADSIPLSRAATVWLGAQKNRSAALVQLATGGDDYEVLCTVPESRLDAFAAEASVPVMVIGRCVEGSGVQLLHEGVALDIPSRGWVHF
jgi:thiamine-monophosphate kinase